MLPFCAKDLQDFVKKWNESIPIDRWYRKKYKIPFGSSAHRNTNLADIFFDFYESIYYKIKVKEDEKNKDTEPYKRGEGNFMKSITYTQKDIDTLFDELNIDEMD